MCKMFPLCFSYNGADLVFVVIFAVPASVCRRNSEYLDSWCKIIFLMLMETDVSLSLYTPKFDFCKGLEEKVEHSKHIYVFSM